MATKPLMREEPGPGMRVVWDLVEVRTEARLEFLDLTEMVQRRVRRSAIHTGLVCVQTRHTTTAIVVNEKEPLLIEDLKRLLERLAPEDAPYGHNDLHRRLDPAPDEGRNGDAHCRAALLGASETLAIADGALQLGRWQSVFLVEMDGPRDRSVSLVVMGTAR